ncbi:MAG: DUF3782 domain-containing protein [Candidatus Kapabacteria bacterium]|jgi:hypothetical protein|nr:DUF3782 domain-containing protein [Candidatus Kapabacteria bacterium]
MTTTLEELQTLVAQSIASTEAFKLSTEAFKAQIAASQETTSAFIAQLAASREEADRLFAAEKAENQRRADEADRRFAAEKAENQRRADEADRRMAEAAEDSRRLKQRLDELGKQLGGLGNKFGSFTEGLLLPSVEGILRRQFGVTDFYMRLKSYHGDQMQELDGFGFVNGANIGFIIEVKSHLDNRAITQAQEQLRRFGHFHPQYKSMKLYGIIAAVDAVSEEQRRAVWNAGLYLVTVHDDVAEMPSPPQGFVPLEEIA